MKSSDIVKIFVIVLVGLFILGFVLPFLISAANTFEAFIGVAILVGVIFGAVLYTNSIINKAFDEKEKESK